MAHEWFTLAELARQLGWDMRELERRASRGRIPGHKRGGDWQFQKDEIADWLEQEMRGYSDSELAEVEQRHQSQEVDADVPLTSLLKLETVAVPLEARTRRSVLEELVDVAGRTWQVWEPAAVLRAVLEREDLCSTAFANGVATPHPRQPLPAAIGESVVAFGRTFAGVPFGGRQGELTDLFFLVLCLDTRTHLQVLARLARMLQVPSFVEGLRAAADPQAAYDVILDAEQSV